MSFPAASRRIAAATGDMLYMPVTGPSASNSSVSSCASSALRRSALPTVIDSETIELGETRVLVGARHARRLPGQGPAEDAPGSGRWRRDLQMFGFGAVAVVVFILAQRVVSRWGPGLARGAACEPPPLAGDQGSTLSFDDAPRAGRRLAGAAGGEAFAFVTMAYDPPGERQSHLWRSLALANAVRKVSRHPLVLLSNSTELVVGGSLWSYLGEIGVRVLPVYEVALATKAAQQMKAAWRVAFWKLQIWRLTEYKRLLWLDSDAVLFRGVNEVFLRDAVLGLRCEETCASQSRQLDRSVARETALCGGVMLLEPDAAAFQEMILFASQYDTWARRGDQQLILDYFRYVKKRPVQALDLLVAAPGACLDGPDGGRGAGAVAHELRGRVSWPMPAAVHRSSEKNECFDFDLAAQRTSLAGRPVNICAHHPLGAYWRDLFCEAARAVQTRGVVVDLWAQVAEFCADMAWFARDERNNTVWLAGA